MERNGPLARKKPIVLALILLSLMAALVFWRAKSSAVPVEVATATEREIRRTVVATGHFAAAEEKEIFARYPMLVERILVEPGDRVQKGQILLQGDTAELEAEKESLRAELAAVEAEITGLEKSLPLRMAEAESGVLAAREAYAQAEHGLKAAKALYEAGALTEMELREAEARFSAAKAQWQSAETRLAEAKTLSATLAGNRQRLRALKARLDLVEEKLATLQVRAPEDGCVAEVLVKEGAAVTAGTHLLTLDMPGLLVEAEVLAQDAPALKTGQKTIVKGEVLGGNQVLGRLRKIHPRAVEKVSELGIKERRVPVEIVLNEKVNRMQPGYPVEVEIVVAEKKALAVPQDAVFKLTDQSYVFQVQGGRAVLTAVTCGLEGDDYVEIVSGLQGGDVVIVNPPKEVSDGKIVKPVNL